MKPRSSHEGLGGTASRRAQPPVGPGWFLVHVFALCGFAVAQPIYGWLSRQPEFLVAHRLDWVGVALLVGLLSGVVPGVIAAAALWPRVLGRSAGRVAQYVAIGALGGLLTLPVWSEGVVWRAFLLAGVVGSGLAIAYAKLAAVRSFLSVCALGAVAFPVVFVAQEPVRSMAFGTASTGRPLADGDRRPRTDVVLVVLDEFPLAALLEDERTIDAERFPNFARLAETSTWFPNATAVHIATPLALPALVSGRMPDPTRMRPRWQEHPHTVFTWAASVYGEAVVGVECITRLCPPGVCGQERIERSTALAGLGLDVSVLLGYALLPEKLARSHLPEIDNRWRDFVEIEPQPSGAARFWAHVRSNRVRVWRRFVRRVGPGFSYLHILLPHGPYGYLPEETQYGGRVQGMDASGNVWQSKELSRVEYQRFLAQLQVTDRLLGELIDELQAEGRWEHTLLVVTADHGKSFRVNTHKRHVSPLTLQDVLNVPLFVKKPGQSEERVDEYRATVLDIVPTVASLVGRELPWTTDGVSLVAPHRERRRVVRVSCLAGACGVAMAARARDDVVALAPEEIEASDALGWKRSSVMWSSALGFFVPPHPHADLLGRRVDELASGRDASSSVELYDVDRFENVDPRRAVPALVRGRLRGARPRADLTLAVAINGRVVGLASPVARDGAPGYFAALVPTSAFVAGRNEPAIYVIQPRPSQEPSLARLALAGDGRGAGF